MSIQRTISPAVGLSLALVACRPAASGTPPAPTIAQPPHAAEEVRECDPSPMQGAAEAALADVEGRGTVVLVDLASGEELVLAATERADTAAPPASTVKP